jgi:hypothetical protein
MRDGGIRVSDELTAALRVALATGLCSTFDLGHHDHEAFLQADHCEAGLADAAALLPYVRAALAEAPDRDAVERFRRALG